MLLNNRVLLLNSSYEPLLVVTAKKAILLYFTDKVEIIENSNNIVRSIYIEFQIPSIIRLKKYVYVKKKELSLTRKNVLKRDGHTCQYCGSITSQLTIDHIIPKQKGGIDNWENLVAGDDALEARLFKIEECPPLIFECHQKIFDLYTKNRK